MCQAATQRVIAISKRVKNDLALYYGRTTGVEVVYHGTDTVTFHPDNRPRYRASVRASLGIHDDRFIALYVGDMKKGVVAAIQAIARTPGTTLVVLSASDPEPYRAVTELEGVANRVRFHRHSKTVERFFAAADAFVFPTVYDPYGLVISEAMASGLPVITSPTAGAAELIEHGTDGLLSETPWDVKSIASHLANLRDDEALRERMGVAARSKIEPYSWDRTAVQTLEVYREVTSGS